MLSQRFVFVPRVLIKRTSIHERSDVRLSVRQVQEMGGGSRVSRFAERGTARLLTLLVLHGGDLPPGGFKNRRQRESFVVQLNEESWSSFKRNNAEWNREKLTYKEVYITSKVSCEIFKVHSRASATAICKSASIKFTMPACLPLHVYSC